MGCRTKVYKPVLVTRAGGSPAMTRERGREGEREREREGERERESV